MAPSWEKLRPFHPGWLNLLTSWMPGLQSQAWHTQGGASICLPFTRKWEAERW